VPALPCPTPRCLNLPRLPDHSRTILTLTSLAIPCLPDHVFPKLASRIRASPAYPRLVPPSRVCRTTANRAMHSLSCLASRRLGTPRNAVPHHAASCLPDHAKLCLPKPGSAWPAFPCLVAHVRTAAGRGVPCLPNQGQPCLAASCNNGSRRSMPSRACRSSTSLA